MPYSSEWVEPEIAVECDGVTIYHLYKDDDCTANPASTYHFGLRETSSYDEDEGDTFDVRELFGWTGCPHPPYMGFEYPWAQNAYVELCWKIWHEIGYEERHIQRFLRDSIRAGWITQDSHTLADGQIVCIEDD